MRLILEVWKVQVVLVIRVEFSTEVMAYEVHISLQVKTEGLGFTEKTQINIMLINKMFQVVNIPLQSLYIPCKDLKSDGGSISIYN